MDTICDHLLFDHKRCDDLFALTESCVAERHWYDSEICFQNFQHAFQLHIQMEEQILLPAFAHAMDELESPIALLHTEHQRIFGLIERMAEALQRRDQVDFVLHSETFIITTQQHSTKEETMLYPLLDKLPASTRNNIIEAMREHLGLDAAVA